MNHFEQNLEKYAELLVRAGLNIQPDQTLFLNADISSADFAREIAKKGYEAGAKHVHIEWRDEKTTRLKYDMAPDEAFTEFPEWKAKGLEDIAKNGGAFLSLVSANPDLLKGVDPERIANFNKAAGAALKTYRQFVQSDKVSWCVAAVPSEAWAAKVFPDVDKAEQEDKLWEAIFKATRADLESPVEAWKNHNAKLDEKVTYLNNKKYKALHYKAPGTDLRLALPEKHLWVGGGSVNEAGTEFIANIPTEEVFTTPLKEGVDGVVSSTKPLSYGGNLIDNFSFRFEKGRIVEVKAEQGEETLKRLVATDEGSHYLGEVALVPHDSPISNSGILFYNTLFDENASNHLAIGNSYAFCIEGGKTMSQDELAQNGLNNSITHVDFMIGSAEMDIDGELEDGTLEPVFRKGNWAF